MKSCKECGNERCLLNQTEGYCLDCPECGVNWKEREMEFDKSRCYSALNADELKAGDKVIVADTIHCLEVQVKGDVAADTICQVNPPTWGKRFSVGAGNISAALAYLVERAENCTNCEKHEDCGYVQNVSKFACLNRCDNYKPKTEEKAEPHYRPFRDTNELIKVWNAKIGMPRCLQTDGAWTMPLIWVKNKEDGARELITGFSNIAISIGIAGNSMKDLYDEYTFLDGSPCGVGDV